MTRINIEVDDRDVVRALNELLRRGDDLSPAMASIAAELLSLTELACRIPFRRRSR